MNEILNLHVATAFFVLLWLAASEMERRKR